MRERNRVRAFVVLAVAGAVAALALAATAVLRAAQDRGAGERAVRAAQGDANRILTDGAPFAVVRTLDRAHPGTYGRIAVAPLDGTSPGTPVPAGPPCQRIAVAAGGGLCLDVLGANTTVTILDSQLRPVSHFTVPGVPSRARISPDGRWGGVTTFVVGHAYANAGQFSTLATLVDMRAGRAVGDLEKDFTFTRDGTPVRAQDRNFWGFTFARDGDTFYATMATGGHTYLVRGSIGARRGRTIHDNVECPSLSPDGTRIAYKKAVAYNPTAWRFHVLDLTTGRQTPLAETRSIDDQIAWLDNGHVLYGDGTRVWMANADGSGQPRAWMADADSPTVER